MELVLKDRHKEILRFIRNYPRRISPTVREIGKAVGLSSSSSIQGYLDELESGGYISRIPGSPRSIELLRWDFNPEDGEEQPHVQRQA